MLRIILLRHSVIRWLDGYFSHFCGGNSPSPAWSCCSCVTALSEVETWRICAGCSISHINASSWQFTLKTEAMCWGFRWHTCFLSTEGETLWPGPGHDCYITGLPSLHSLPSSAEKIATMFSEILGYPSLVHIIFVVAPSTKYLTCHLPCLLLTFSILL